MAPRGEARHRRANVPPSPRPALDIRPKQSLKFAHPKAVNAAVFSPDASRILAVCADGAARVWVPGARDPQLVLASGHTGALLCGAFSPDGLWIATGGEDKRAVVWNANTGRPLLAEPLQGHSAAVTSVAFSEHGARLLTGSRDSTAKLWDPRIVRPKVDVPRGAANAERADEDEKEGDGNESNTDAGDTAPQPAMEKLYGKELLTLRGHSAGITAVAFSPDGDCILTGSLDNSAILWLTNRTVLVRRELEE